MCDGDRFGEIDSGVGRGGGGGGWATGQVNQSDSPCTIKIYKTLTRSNVIVPSGTSSAN